MLNTASPHAGSTYIPTTRDMLDIVLGTQARRNMAVVHFFGDYLNLQHSTAGIGQKDIKDYQIREGQEKRESWSTYKRERIHWESATQVDEDSHQTSNYS